MIRAVIIDDEAQSRAVLREMLTKFCPEVKVLGESGDFDETLDMIAELKPNLAFLDINMPNGSGFDVLRAFPQSNFEVIFITAHNEYAIRAIRASALDFLLKPVNIYELQEAVRRAGDKLSKQDEYNHLNVLIENLGLNSGTQGRVAIPDGSGLSFVTLKDIIRLEADGSYTMLHLQNGKHILSTRHLKEYEELLPHKLFFRSHHSHIINLEHITGYTRGEGGSVTMSDNSEVLVARRKKKLFLEIFKV